MSDLFLPKEQKDLGDLITEKFVASDLSGDEVLLVGTEDGIYAYDNFNSEPKNLQGGSVFDICVHDDSVYAGDNDGAMFGVISMSVFGTRDSSVYGMCGHDGSLYDCGFYGLYDSFSDKKILNYRYHNMISYDGRLYASDWDGEIVDVFKKKTIVERGERVRCMIEYNGEAYDCGEYGLYEGLGDIGPELEGDIYGVFGFEGKIFYLDVNDFVFELGTGRRFEINGLDELDELYNQCSKRNNRMEDK